MGGCCSKQDKNDGLEMEEEEDDEYDDGEAREGVGGARVRVQGSCKMASMFTKQGRKGVNQDAMTVWEDFSGEKDEIFCGVFDGHGPLGHKVACHVRDVLPSKLSSLFKKQLEPYDDNGDDDHDENNNDDDDDDDDDDEDSDDSHDSDDPCHPSFSSWKTSFIKAFKAMDKELDINSSIDCFCSGSTAVSVLKQGDDLIIANLGDSRAILCTRDDNNQLVPVQLTVDLKPNVPSEAERIRSCRGRVFALEEEPDVHRLWLPNDDCPGLAMARAFGDFCLKDFGLISTPEVSYRKITERDEFVVLATDGVWDVLSNKEVIKIVASARKRSMAAKLLVDRAVRSWKCKYPTSKIDDCAVVCLFMKQSSSFTKLASDVLENDMKCQQTSFSDSLRTISSDPGNSVQHGDTKEEWNALEGVSRVNSLLKLPRFSSVMSWRKRSTKEESEG